MEGGKILFITKLLLENFRCFDKKEIEFNSRFSVIAGENGSGKTAILEGLCIALGGWLYGFDGIEISDKRNIYEEDKRVILAKVNSAALTQIPVVVECTAKIYEQEIVWDRKITSRNGRTTHGGLSEIKKIANIINQKIYSAEDEEIILPVVAYYSSARLWNEPIQKQKSYKKENVRIEAYKKSISFSNSIKNTMTYINTIAYAAEQDEMYMAEFNAIMNAIEKSIHSVLQDSKVSYNKKIAEIVITDKDNKSILYSKLSDGYRCIISLIADICIRMVTLNPQLKENAIKETTGVVLIDEIDLHLHPKWQKCVINDLKEIFPKVQFIVTTHSPFIIQSLDNGELISLNEDIETDYSGESIEDISENIMGIDIPQYSHYKEEMYKAAKDYFEALDKATTKNEIEDLKIRLDLLSTRFGENVAYYAFIEQKYYAKEFSLEVSGN